MRVLAIDIGSSSIKAAVLTGPKPQQVERVGYQTTYAGDRVEVPAANILKAVTGAIGCLGDAARHVDLIAFTGMAPSWLAVDKNGKPLTPVVTHQDRRSQLEAERIEAEVGRARHMHLTGNRPVPGGISSTTAAWFVRHARPRMKAAVLIGHLNTWLVNVVTGGRVIDPSNASFTGLYRTTNLGGWDDQLIAAAGVKREWLPDVIDGNVVAGRVSRRGATRLGVADGTPVLAGVIDGSGGLLLAGPEPGRVLNVVGSTDVLAVVTDRARPFDGLLTRALGVGRRWLSVGTVAAAGSALDWARRTLYGDLTPEAFYKHVAAVSRRPNGPRVTFDARLAGSRTAVEPVRATVGGLSLATDRDAILAGLLDSLAAQSAARFDLFRRAKVPFDRHAYSTGGGDGTLARVLRRDWPGEWRFKTLNEATLAGAWRLAETAVERA